MPPKKGSNNNTVSLIKKTNAPPTPAPRKSAPASSHASTRSRSLSLPPPKKLLSASKKYIEDDDDNNDEDNDIEIEEESDGEMEEEEIIRSNKNNKNKNSNNKNNNNNNNNNKNNKNSKNNDDMEEDEEDDEEVEEEEEEEENDGEEGDDDIEIEDDGEEDEDDEEGEGENVNTEGDSSSSAMDTDNNNNNTSINGIGDLLPATASKSDNLEYDLGNLSAFDISPLALDRLHSEGNDYLQELSRDNAQLLINKLFSLPNEAISGEIGRLAILPDPLTRIPREKPLPKAKALTKWQMFAQLKGINPKKKRERQVWDEERGEYANRYGYKRTGRLDDEAIIEHSNKIDTGSDPWAQDKKKKKENVTKNEKQKQLNLKAASGKRVPGAIDLGSVSDTLKGGKKEKDNGKAGVGKNDYSKNRHIDLSLGLAQRSTASLGKFDRRSKDEPALKGKENTTSRPSSAPLKAKSISDEKKASLSVLRNILGEDSGKKRESDYFNVNKAIANFSGESKKKEKGGSRKKK